MYVTNFTDIVAKMSDGSMIKGKVNIRGDYNRLSDFLKYSTEQFVVIVLEDSGGDAKKVLFVNKNYIVWAGSEN